MPTASEQTVLTVLELAQAGRFAEIPELFAPQLRALVAPEVLETAWTAELAKQGPVTSVGAALSEPGPAGAVVVKVPVTCERGGFALIAAASDEGKLSGLQIAPLSAAAPIAPWEPPGYTDPAGFDEHEVTVGPEPVAVPGTLAVPHGAGPWPGVVLLAGSGSLDRDETIGRNKPFKDIAWGLATRGVAVLRFDKVTFTHAGGSSRRLAVHVRDEYLPARHRGDQTLREHPGVDPARVYVLGHSLGGTVAPRVAAAEPGRGRHDPHGRGCPAAALGHRPPDPLSRLAEPRHRGVIPASDRRAHQKAGWSTAPTSRPRRRPANYRSGLRRRTGSTSAAMTRPRLAAALDTPMLILQGGRDYQVTVADDLARWRAALDGRPDVTIRVYPDFIGLAGGVTGEAVRAGLAAAGVPAAFTPIAGETRRTFAVVDQVSHDTALFNEPGPAVMAGEYDEFLVLHEKSLAGCQAVVMSGSLPPGLPANTYAWPGRAGGGRGGAGGAGRRGRRAGARGGRGPGDRQAEPGRAGGRGAPAAGRPGRCRGCRGGTARRRGGRGGGVTRRRRPARGDRRRDLARGAAGRVAGNPTGAGDAVVAGLAHGLVLGRPWPERLRHATALGTASVAAPGAGQFAVADYERALAGTRVTQWAGG